MPTCRCLKLRKSLVGVVRAGSILLGNAEYIQIAQKAKCTGCLIAWGGGNTFGVFPDTRCANVVLAQP
jgi:hypothetical protein